MKEIKFLPFGKNGITNQPLPEKSAFNGMTKHSSVSSIKSGVKALVALACFGASTMMNASNSMCPEISEVMAAPAVSSVQASSSAYLKVREQTFSQLVLNYQTSNSKGAGDPCLCCFSYSVLSQYGGPVNAFNNDKYLYRNSVHGYGYFSYDLTKFDEGIYVFCLLEKNETGNYMVTASNSCKVDRSTRIDSYSCDNTTLYTSVIVNENDNNANNSPKLRISYRGNRCNEWSLRSGENKDHLDVSRYGVGSYDLQLIINGAVKETKTFTLNPYTNFTDNGLKNELTMNYRLRTYASSKVELYYYNKGTLETNSTATFELGSKFASGTYTFNTVTWKAGTYCARIYEGTKLISQKNVKVSPVGPLVLANNTQTKTMTVKYKLPEGTQFTSPNAPVIKIFRTKDLEAVNGAKKYEETKTVYDQKINAVSGTISFDYNYWNSGNYSICLFDGKYDGETLVPLSTKTFSHTFTENRYVAAEYDATRKKVTIDYCVSASEEDVEIRILFDDIADFEDETIMAAPAVKTITIKPYQKRSDIYTLSVSRWSEGIYIPILIENGEVIDPCAYFDVYFLGSNARSAVRGLDDIEEATAIESISTESVKDGKRIENGKVVIYRNGVKYNISGQQIKE